MTVHLNPIIMSNTDCIYLKGIQYEMSRNDSFEAI